MNKEESSVTEEAAVEPLPPIIYEHTIAGRRVTLKRRVVGKDAKGLPEMVGTIGDVINEPLKLAPLGKALIESWEFEGSPAEEASYGELDIFDEIFPLAQVLIGYFNARATRMSSLKN